MTGDRVAERITGRRLKVLRTVAYFWYRDQHCWPARLVRILDEGCRNVIYQDVDQLVFDGFLEEETVITDRGRIHALSLTANGWTVLGRADDLFE